MKRTRNNLIATAIVIPAALALLANWILHLNMPKPLFLVCLVIMILGNIIIMKETRIAKELEEKAKEAPGNSE